MVRYLRVVNSGGGVNRMMYSWQAGSQKRGIR
jgi:hypothetical protein